MNNFELSNQDWLDLYLKLTQFYNYRLTILEQKGYDLNYMSDTQVWNAGQKEFKDDLLKCTILLIRKCDKEMH